MAGKIVLEQVELPKNLTSDNMEEDLLQSWPPLEGRYRVGNKKSPVAVCTNASVEGIELDMEKVAIIGKCVTENIGIEKIVQNIVANHHIRFLILCGKVSKGHFVSQALMSLKKDGIDGEKKIIGAQGNTPFLKSVNENLIEKFRQQIEIIDLTPETDSARIMKEVENCLKRDPGPFSGEAVKIEKIDEIEAQACHDWMADPCGYFVISLDKERKKILVEHFDFDENKLDKKIIGSSAIDIYKTIAGLDLISNFEQTQEHAMYLAKELQKAELALKYNLDYEQDSDLEIIKVDKKIKINNESTDENGWFD